jgi:AGZA family xanthine/uracil permease-like MFS transporter
MRTEVLAGATTFLTMAYIILVNRPFWARRAAGGQRRGGHLFAAAFASILMGRSPTPAGAGAGHGAERLFQLYRGATMHVPWPIALGCVFVSGAIF